MVSARYITIAPSAPRCANAHSVSPSGLPLNSLENPLVITLEHAPKLSMPMVRLAYRKISGLISSDSIGILSILKK